MQIQRKKFIKSPARVNVAHSGASDGCGWLFDAFAELLCLGEELGTVDCAKFIDSVGADHADFLAALVAVRLEVGDPHLLDFVPRLFRTLGPPQLSCSLWLKTYPPLPVIEKLCLMGHQNQGEVIHLAVSVSPDSVVAASTVLTSAVSAR